MNDNYEAMTTKGEHVAFRIDGAKLRWYVDDVQQEPIIMTPDHALISTLKRAKMLGDNLDEMEAALDAEVEAD